MAVIAAQEAPVFDTGNAVITGLASPSRGAADAAVWRVRLAPGQPSVLHSLTREETFVVLEGTVTARFAEHDESASAGGALIVPAGVEFSLLAEREPAEAVCVMVVGGQAVTDEGTFTPPWAE
jgi:quercetin dioxygenase-like cupin family protein